MSQHEFLLNVLLGAGGTRAEQLMPDAYRGRIADVAFDSGDLIVEIKSIEADRASDPSVQENLGELITKLAARFGGPVVFGQVRIQLDELPDPIGKRALRYLGKSIQAAARDASRQIGASKNALGREHAHGLLAIITPPFEINPHVIGWLLNDLLDGGRYPAINSVLVVQSEHGLRTAIGPNPESFISFHGREGRSIALELKQRIAESWVAATGEEYKAATEKEFFDKFP